MTIQIYGTKKIEIEEYLAFRVDTEVHKITPAWIENLLASEQIGADTGKSEKELGRTVHRLLEEELEDAKEIGKQLCGIINEVDIILGEEQLHAL